MRIDRIRCMATDWSLVWRISGPAWGGGVGIWLSHWLERKPKLVSYLWHASAFQIRTPGKPDMKVHTHGIVIRNTGKKPATNIRVSHLTLPINYQVFPDVKHQVEELPNGGRDIVFPILVPGEQVSISYLYYPPLLWSQVHAGIKSDDGFAQELTVLPTPQLKGWQLWGLRMLIIIGSLTVLYAFFSAAGAAWNWFGSPHAP